MTVKEVFRDKEFEDFKKDYDDESIAEEDYEFACDFCHSEVDKLYEVDDPIPRSNPYHARICEVCYTTDGGNAHRYPKQYQNYEAIKMISQCTNIILKALKK